MPYTNHRGSPRHRRDQHPNDANDCIEHLGELEMGIPPWPMAILASKMMKEDIVFGSFSLAGWWF